MATIMKGKHDENVRALRDALESYEQDFPGAEASLYRQNSGSVRVRVVDDRFDGMSRSRRHDKVSGYLKSRVSQDAMDELSLLLLLPRGEMGSSMANMEFEDPTPSRL